jgi:F-type H+-transporting ATPase subunit delta
VAGAAARRYARAIFDLAQEEGQVEDWADRLADIRQVFSVPEVASVLDNPTITRERRAEAISEVLGERTNREAVNLAKLLVESGRVRLVGDIVEEYSALADEAAGRVRATATAAVELTQPEKEGLARNLAARLAREVVLQTTVDPAILGGLVVRIGDRVIDASVATRLRQLRQRLAGV